MEQSPSPVSPSGPNPLAWRFYVAYCWCSFLLHAAWIAFLVLGWQHRVGLIEQYAGEYDPSYDAVLGPFLGGLILVALVFGVGALFLIRTRRTPGAWVTHLINLAIGASTIILAPIALPTIFLWFRPETRAWFGRS